ncbi:MAG: hypothetical protein ABF557_11390, partial [Liquorilactobacillus hordei]
MSKDKLEPVWLSENLKLYQALDPIDPNNKNKFYKNDINHELKKDTDSAIDSVEFKKIVKNESLKFINNKFDNIVVLVGAGASVTDNEFKKDENGIARAGVTVAKIADEVLEELSNEDQAAVFSLEKMASMSK